MTAFRAFRPAALAFLKGLKKNNRREWFEERRQVYVHEIVEPLRALVDELDVRFAKLAPEYMGDPKRSPFRIYRDVRFSKDKSPYKSHAALWMYHRAPGRGVGKEVDGGAGFYVHLEPGACMVAGGIWMPPRPSLAKVRAHFSEDLGGWKKAIGSATFKKRFVSLNSSDPGALLKRIPRGFDENHPAAAWLRYNSFTVSADYTDAEMLAPTFVDRAMSDFALMLPMCRWLNRALGFLPAKSR